MENYITVSCPPPRVSVIPHKKIHYFENFHYLGKFPLFKEKQVKDTTGFTF